MESILEELEKFITDEDKVEYLNLLVCKEKILIYPNQFYQICSHFIFDCNRNEMLKKLIQNFEIQKINESDLYQILKLYIFDFERNIAFRLLKPFTEEIKNIKSFEQLYTYFNEKSELIFINNRKINEENKSVNSEKVIFPRKSRKSSCAT